MRIASEVDRTELPRFYNSSIPAERTILKIELQRPLWFRIVLPPFFMRSHALWLALSRPDISDLAVALENVGVPVEGLGET
jgi:hypothetical protein